MRSDSLLAVEVLALAIAVGTVTAIPVYAALRLIDQRPLTNNARVALGLIQPFVLVIGLLALFKALPDAMSGELPHLAVIVWLLPTSTVLVIALLARPGRPFVARPLTWLSLSEVGATIVGPLIVLILITQFTPSDRYVTWSIAALSSIVVLIAGVSSIIVARVIWVIVVSRVAARDDIEALLNGDDNPSALSRFLMRLLDRVATK